MASESPFDAMMPTAVRAFRYSGFRSIWAFRSINLRMTKGEVDLFASVLNQNSQSPYLEFGTGGSTLLAAGIVPKVFSVENDFPFIQATNRRMQTRPKRANPNFIYIDQGPLEAWGYPVTDDPATLRQYAESVWRNALLPPTIKTVLVDGRFRRACLLNSILHLHSSIDYLLHDANRYTDVTKDFFIEVNRIDNLQHLRKKPGITDAKIRACLTEVDLDKS